MNEQPEALRLAEWLESDATNGDMGRKPDPKCNKRKAAAELRRLHAANIDCVDHFNALKAERDELLEALKGLLEDTEHKDHKCGDQEWCPVLRARAAISKATGDQA